MLLAGGAPLRRQPDWADYTMPPNKQQSWQALRAKQNRNNKPLATPGAARCEGLPGTEAAFRLALPSGSHTLHVHDVHRAAAVHVVVRHEIRALPIAGCQLDVQHVDLPIAVEVVVA